MNRKKLGLGVFLAVVIPLAIIRLTGFDSSKTFTFEFKSSSLGNVMQQSLQRQEGIFAVYIEDLTSGEKYGLRENDPFPAASLYKLVLLAAALQEVEGGKIKMEDTLASTKTHLSGVLGSEDFGYEDEPEEITYSVEEALTRLGRISDNYAAIMLTEKLRGLEQNDPLPRMAKNLGMAGTSFGGVPTTTAADIAAFFKKLYRGEVVSPAASGKIMDLLSLSKINDRIPARLPEDIKVVHKSGEMPQIRHDAGIVYLPGRPYLIVLLGKDLPYEDDGVETLARVSQDVWEYFRGKN